MIVSTSYFHIYKAYRFCDYAAIQNVIKSPNISSCETYGMKSLRMIWSDKVTNIPQQFYSPHISINASICEREEKMTHSD